MVTLREESCCGLCGKPWQIEGMSTPRRCAFEGEVFSPDNSNCGLVNRLRDEMTTAAASPHALHVRDDSVFGNIGALVVNVPDAGDLGNDLSGLLVAQWRKSRACTDTLAWGIAATGMDGRALTREQARVIVAYLDDQERRREEAEARAAQPETPTYGWAQMFSDLPPDPPRPKIKGEPN